MSTLTTSRGWRLWIDGCGVFRLHGAETLTVGGPSEAGPGEARSADLSLLAPLSRLHARLESHGERFRFVPLGTAAVNGQSVTEAIWLDRKAEVSLGDELLGPVRLRVTQPSHLSASARIEFVSEHRPARALDGLVVLRGACLLGPASGHHIVWPKCDPPLVLFSQGDRLAFRGNGDWLVDGETKQGVVLLEPGATLSRGELRVRVEPVPVTGEMVSRIGPGWTGASRSPEVVSS